METTWNISVHSVKCNNTVCLRWANRRIYAASTWNDFLDVCVAEETRERDREKAHIDADRPTDGRTDSVHRRSCVHGAIARDVFWQPLTINYTGLQWRQDCVVGRRAVITDWAPCRTRLIARSLTNARNCAVPLQAGSSDADWKFAADVASVSRRSLSVGRAKDKIIIPAAIAWVEKLTDFY